MSIFKFKVVLATAIHKGAPKFNIMLSQYPNLKFWSDCYTYRHVGPSVNQTSKENEGKEKDKEKKKRTKQKVVSGENSKWLPFSRAGSIIVDFEIYLKNIFHGFRDMSVLKLLPTQIWDKNARAVT